MEWQADNERDGLTLVINLEKARQGGSECLAAMNGFDRAGEHACAVGCRDAHGAGAGVDTEEDAGAGQGGEICYGHRRLT